MVRLATKSFTMARLACSTAVPLRASSYERQMASSRFFDAARFERLLAFVLPTSGSRRIDVVVLVKVVDKLADAFFRVLHDNHQLPSLLALISSLRSF